MVKGIKDVRQEATEMLRDMIRIDTSNPPGNELKAIEYIVNIARINEIEYEVMETAPGRGNVILKLKGTETGSPLILLSHLDVVGANKEHWQEAPFEGAIADGYIWGRGTIDTKQLTVMELMALISLKRAGMIPRRDIYLIATADEESGSTYGIKALLREKGHIFESAEVISEGGGFPIRVADRTYYLCETGQKGTCTVKFTFKKKAGANPYYPENTGISNCSRLIKALNAYKWEGELPATTAVLIDKLIEGLGGDSSAVIEEKLELLKDKVSPFFMNIMNAMTHNTIAVTMWKGGRKSNVTQHESEVIADIRLLPGVTREAVEEHLGKIIGDMPVEWEVKSFLSGYDSSCNGGLFEEFVKGISDMLPGNEVIPFIATGGSDGRFLGEYNAKVYGFSPVLVEDMTFEKAVSMVHGVNERISIDSLVFGTEVLTTTLINYCCGGN